MKRNFFFIALLVALLLPLWTYAVPDAAASSWQWVMTLQESDTQEVMGSPTAIYVDENLQRYYVADSGNNRLLSYEKEGKFQSSFSASGKLQVPYDLVREPGLLWVIEKGRNTITIVDLKEKKITPRQISYRKKTVYPDRFEIDKDVLFLLDKASGSILTLDKNLEPQVQFTCKECDGGGFVDFKLRNGSLWALEQSTKSVYKFSLDGKLEDTIKLATTLLDFPRSLEVDSSGFLYILDRHRGSVLVFNPMGQFKYSFLESGQARGQLYYPIQLKFDPWGRLCIVDEGNGRVQVFSQK